MPYCKSNGINIYYEVKGEGEPLLLITGITASTLIWQKYFIDELAKNYQVIIFDNRGAGKTDAPDSPYSMDQFALDTIGLMNHLNLDKIHLYGESMGGMIAQNTVLQYPNRFQSLVLAVTSPGKNGFVVNDDARELLLNHRKGDYNEDMWKFYKFLYTPEFFSKHEDEFRDLLKNPPDYPIQQAYAYRHQLISTITSHDTKERLHEIEIPTLILVGMRDNLIPPDNSLLLHKLIPNSKLVKYEKAAHMYRFEARSSVFDILEFLASIN